MRTYQKNESEIDIVQQTGICQGIVKDATGESVIGASVIVKGTTNGTILFTQLLQCLIYVEQHLYPQLKRPYNKI